MLIFIYVKAYILIGRNYDKIVLCGNKTIINLSCHGIISHPVKESKN